jgi:hypothetical protein
LNELGGGVAGQSKDWPLRNANTHGLDGEEVTPD